MKRTAASERVDRPAPEIPAPDRNAMLRLFEQMTLLRRFEAATQVAHRKGETPGFLHLYIGEEATAVGVCAHLRPTDWITSTHRGHGHALAKGVSPKALMAELFGKRDGICGGRGGTMHLYDRSVGLFGTNGIVAAGIGHAVGAGLSARLRGTDDIGVAFFGDGAVSHGGFHESVNFAAVQRAPVVFICENNLYATATPITAATLNTEIATKAAAYGIPGVAVDGNDVLAVWNAMQVAADRARTGGGPTLIEAKTYRTVGHHEGEPVAGTYRGQAEIDGWAKRDPIVMFGRALTETLKLATDRELNDIEFAIDAIVDEALAFARNSPDPDPATVMDHAYANPLNPPEALASAPTAPTKITSWIEAVRDGVGEEMRRNPHTYYFGEGTGERGGSFAHTKGLWAEFGGHRMVDTPISEQGFTAAALGASATGARSVSDLMFADFAFEAAGQIVLQAAKLRYMSNGQMSAPMIVRLAGGSLRSAGPHHSGTYHPMWAHVPGLIVCMPSTPADAKGLLKTAFRSADPVIMLESKALFSSKGEVSEGEHLVPFGVARTARAGRDLTIVSAGQLVHRCLEAAEVLAAEGIECEVIDLRTIMPLDVTSVAASVSRTHRLLVVDEGWAMNGVGAEIGQAMNELAFDQLDAPVARLHTAPISHPFAPSLERAMLVDTARILAAARGVMGGVARHDGHWRNPAIQPEAPSEPVPEVAARKETVALEVTPVMDGAEPITMPFGDLTVSEGKVIKWHKTAGEAVEPGVVLVEVETDKAVVEIEAPRRGILLAVEQPAGSVVKMGQRIGLLRPLS